MAATVYRISKWREVFETSESRKYKRLSWYALPIDFASTGYHAMLDEFESDAPALYGAWCALVAVAASCTVRGVLASSRGRSLPVSQIARMTGFPPAIFEKLFVWATRSEIGWLEEVDFENAQENTDFSEPESTPGYSPGDLPEPSRHAGRIPALHNITVHNRTLQNTTTTEQRTVVGDVVVDEIDLEEVKRQAAKLWASKTVQKHLSRREVWEVAWVAVAIGNLDLCGELYDSIRAGKFGKLKPWIRGAMVKCCTKAKQDWDELQSIVPDPAGSK